MKRIDTAGNTNDSCALLTMNDTRTFTYPAGRFIVVPDYKPYHQPQTLHTTPIQGNKYRVFLSFYPQECFVHHDRKLQLHMVPGDITAIPVDYRLYHEPGKLPEAAVHTPRFYAGMLHIRKAVQINVIAPTPAMSASYPPKKDIRFAGPANRRYLSYGLAFPSLPIEHHPNLVHHRPRVQQLAWMQLDAIHPNSTQSALVH